MGQPNSAYKRLMNKMKAIGVITPFEQSVVSKPRTWLQSDFLNLNWALGHGIPFGCLWELIGAESSGKSSMSLSLAASLQKTHGALIIPYDTERMDDSMLSRTGLDLSMAAIPEPEAKDCLANVVNHMMVILKTIIEAEEEGDYEADGPVPVVMIWDSIAATATQTMQQAMNNTRDKIKVGIIAEQMGATANQLTTALKTLHPAIVRANVLAIFVNQMRVTIATPGVSQWGGPQEHSGGGRALKHASNIRGKMKYENIYKNFNAGKKDITKGGQLLGINCSLEMIKNKLAAPFKKIGFVNMFQTGLDVHLSTILHAMFDLQEAEVMPPLIRGRVEWGGKKHTLLGLSEELRDNPIAWGEFREMVLEGQRKIDEMVTPEDLAARQRKADLEDNDREDTVDDEYEGEEE